MNRTSNRIPTNMAFHMPRGPFEAFFTFQGIGITLLLMAVLMSAIAVVVSKHLSRSLHIQLQELHHHRDVLHIEWSRLLLEQSTLGSDARVEKIASEQLGMKIPNPKQVMVLRP